MPYKSSKKFNKTKRNNRKTNSNVAPVSTMRALFSGSFDDSAPHSIVWNDLPAHADGTVRISSIEVTVVASTVGLIRIVLYDHSGEEIIASRPIPYGYIPKTIRLAMPKSTDFGLPTLASEAVKLTTTASVATTFSIILNYSIKMS